MSGSRILLTRTRRFWFKSPIPKHQFNQDPFFLLHVRVNFLKKMVGVTDENRVNYEPQQPSLTKRGEKSAVSKQPTRPVSGNPRRRVSFQNRNPPGKCSRRPHSAGQTRRSFVKKHPDLIRFESGVIVPAPIRSKAVVEQRRKTKLSKKSRLRIAAKTDKTPYQTAKTAFQSTGTPSTNPSTSPLHTAGSARQVNTTLELQHRVDRQKLILASYRREMKALRTELRGCKAKNRKLCRRYISEIAVLKKTAAAAQKQPSYTTRMRKERDMLANELQRMREEREHLLELLKAARAQHRPARNGVKAVHVIATKSSQRKMVPPPPTTPTCPQSESNSCAAFGNTNVVPVSGGNVAKCVGSGVKAAKCKTFLKPDGAP